MFSAQDISVKIFILFITNNFWLVNKIVFTVVLCVKYFLSCGNIFGGGDFPELGKCCMTGVLGATGSAQEPKIRKYHKIVVLVSAIEGENSSL